MEGEVNRNSEDKKISKELLMEENLSILFKAGNNFQEICEYFVGNTSIGIFIKRDGEILKITNIEDVNTTIIDILKTMEVYNINLQGEHKDCNLCVTTRENIDGVFELKNFFIEKFFYEIYDPSDYTDAGTGRLKARINALIRTRERIEEKQKRGQEAYKISLEMIDNGIVFDFNINKNEYFRSIEKELVFNGYFNSDFCAIFSEILANEVRVLLHNKLLMFSGEISLNFALIYKNAAKDEAISILKSDNKFTKTDFTIKGLKDYITKSMKSSSFMSYDMYEYNWVLIGISSIEMQVRKTILEFMKPISLEDKKDLSNTLGGKNEFIDGGSDGDEEEGNESIRNDGEDDNMMIDDNNVFTLYDNLISGRVKGKPKTKGKTGMKRKKTGKKIKAGSDMVTDIVTRLDNIKDLDTFLIDPSYMAPRGIDERIKLYNIINKTSKTYEGKANKSKRKKKNSPYISKYELIKFFSSYYNDNQQCYLDALATFIFLKCHEEELYEQETKDLITDKEIKAAEKYIRSSMRKYTENFSWSEPLFREIRNGLEDNIFENTKFPMSLEQIIDYQSSTKVYLNIFLLKETSENSSGLSAIPVYISHYRDDESEKMNLLIVNSHLYLITNFKRFFRRINEENRCSSCFLEFNTSSALIKHKPKCLYMFRDNIIIKKAKKDQIYFDAYKSKIKHPFVLYADFESIISHEGSKDSDKYVHKPCAYSILTDTAYDKLEEDNDLGNFIMDIDKEGKGDIASRFINSILFESRRIAHGLGYVSKGEDGTFTPTLGQKFNKPLKTYKKVTTKFCYLCGKEERPYNSSKKASNEDKKDIVNIDKPNENIANNNIEEQNEKKKIKKKAPKVKYQPDLNNIKYDKIINEHCHITGKFRGFAHSGCNILCRVEKKIYVVMHNAMGYDIHLFLEKLFKGKANVIAKSFDKYLSLTVNEQIFISENNEYPDGLMYSGSKKDYGRFCEKTGDGGNIYLKTIPKDTKEKFIKSFDIVFIDSLNFLKDSLESLILKTEINKKYTDFICRSFIPSYIRNVYAKSLKDNDNIFLKKGIFCYEYLSDYSKLNQKDFPTHDLFANKLKGNVSKVEYERAKNIYTENNLKDLGQYLMVYLAVDVIGLAMVFDRFRNNCLAEYRLDPIYYISMPALTWNSFLLYSEAVLDTIKDERIYLLIEKNIRGGMVKSGPLLHQTANNETSFIKYFDANSLYASVMCNPLPYTDLELVEFTNNMNLDEEIKIIMETEWKDIPYPTIDESEKDKIKKKLLKEFSVNLRLLADGVSKKIANYDNDYLVGFLQDDMFTSCVNRKIVYKDQGKYKANLISMVKNKLFGKKIHELSQYLKEDDKIIFKKEYNELEVLLKKRFNEEIKEHTDYLYMNGEGAMKSRFYCVDIEIPDENFDNFYNETCELPLAPFRGEERLEMIIGNRYNYLVHAELLKFYVSKGYRITKIHCYISFTQRNYLKDYIVSNITKRSQTEDRTLKDLYKLSNNSVFGKTLQNSRKYKKYKFFVTRNENEKINLKPKEFLSIKRSKTIGDYTLCEMIKSDLIIDKPIYIGFTILELSKLTMYRHHYGIKANLLGEVKLMYMDTDSLVYYYTLPTDKKGKKIDSIADDIALTCSKEFDGNILLSNNAKFNSNLQHNFSQPDLEKLMRESRDNVGKIGLLKDEMPEMDIIEFISLRAKCYAFRYYKKDNSNNIIEKKVNKGVSRQAMETVNFSHYLKCLRNKILLGKKRSNMEEIEFKAEEKRLLALEKEEKLVSYAIRKTKQGMETLSIKKNGLVSKDEKVNYDGSVYIGCNEKVSNDKGKMVVKKIPYKDNIYENISLDEINDEFLNEILNILPAVSLKNLGDGFKKVDIKPVHGNMEDELINVPEKISQNNIIDNAQNNIIDNTQKDIIIEDMINNKSIIEEQKTLEKLIQNEVNQVDNLKNKDVLNTGSECNVVNENLQEKEDPKKYIFPEGCSMYTDTKAIENVNIISRKSSLTPSEMEEIYNNEQNENVNKVQNENVNKEQNENINEDNNKDNNENNTGIVLDEATEKAKNDINMQENEITCTIPIENVTIINALKDSKFPGDIIASCCNYIQNLILTSEKLEITLENHKKLLYEDYYPTLYFDFKPFRDFMYSFEYIIKRDFKIVVATFPE